MRSNETEGFTEGQQAMHIAYLLSELVSNVLIESAVVQGNPEWANQANRAADELFALYQALGAEYLAKDEGEDG